ncbi:MULTISPECIES: hypothetical protein [unclassified Kribbella]|uniref:hypothetical protein n=1 Tax=unclassified Kribbella TaxID=2644121 RepID=UPI0034040AE7
MALHQKLIDNRWRAAGTVAAVAATTVAGGVAGGVAWASTGDSTPAPSTSPSQQGQQQDRGPGPRGGLLGDALHGEFVTSKDGGGYQTIATQKGEVTALTDTSITLKSADGYTRTYTINSDTKINRDGKIADLKTGETVRLRAVVAGETATATQVTDNTDRPQGAPEGKPGKPESGSSATPTPK